MWVENLHMLQDESPVGELVHLYVDGAFGRRELIERVTKLTGSLAAAMLALGGFEELRAQATPVPPGVRVAETDPDIEAREVTYSGIESNLYGYLAMPRGLRDQQPGVIVIHENRGLVEHIRDVTRRVAKAGYVALGVDLLSRQGGTAQFTEATQQMQAYNRTLPADRRADLIASLDYLKKQEMVIHDRIGVLGFCAGGGAAWDLIVNVSELRAAVPYYGPPPPAADIARLATPVLAIYAERDRSLTQSMLNTALALSTQQKSYALRVYEGAGHAFHNDTGAAYNATAATEAWADTMRFFTKNLRS
jgi:carboxymethylenebutenolidase